jgi:alkylated DNA repair protein (DNA oxidative demethylase)
MTERAPDGFLYRPDVITVAEEHELADHLSTTEFSAIEMRGQVARRRTAHFGWIYGYESWRITPGPPIPDFLLNVRERVATLADVAPARLAEVLVTEYPPGAGIGWHRDAPQFGEVIGVSLLSECRMRFQRGRGVARETCAMSLAPRSAYVLTGEARQDWQHSITPTRGLRYSVTFRTLKKDRQQG